MNEARDLFPKFVSRSRFPPTPNPNNAPIKHNSDDEATSTIAAHRTDTSTLIDNANKVKVSFSCHRGKWVRWKARGLLSFTEAQA